MAQILILVLLECQLALGDGAHCAGEVEALKSTIADQTRKLADQTRKLDDASRLVAALLAKESSVTLAEERDKEQLQESSERVAKVFDLPAAKRPSRISDVAGLVGTLLAPRGPQGASEQEPTGSHGTNQTKAAFMHGYHQGQADNCTTAAAPAPAAIETTEGSASVQPTQGSGAPLQPEGFRRGPCGEIWLHNSMRPMCGANNILIGYRGRQGGALPRSEEDVAIIKCLAKEGTFSYWRNWDKSSESTINRVRVAKAFPEECFVTPHKSLPAFLDPGHYNAGAQAVLPFDKCAPSSRGYALQWTEGPVPTSSCPCADQFYNNAIGGHTAKVLSIILNLLGEVLYTLSQGVCPNKGSPSKLEAVDPAKHSDACRNHAWDSCCAQHDAVPGDSCIRPVYAVKYSFLEKHSFFKSGFAASKCTEGARICRVAPQCIEWEKQLRCSSMFKMMAGGKASSVKSLLQPGKPWADICGKGEDAAVKMGWGIQERFRGECCGIHMTCPDAFSTEEVLGDGLTLKDAQQARTRFGGKMKMKMPAMKIAGHACTKHHGPKNCLEKKGECVWCAGNTGTFSKCRPTKDAGNQALCSFPQKEFDSCSVHEADKPCLEPPGKCVWCSGNNGKAYKKCRRIGDANQPMLCANPVKVFGQKPKGLMGQLAGGAKDAAMEGVLKTVLVGIFGKFLEPAVKPLKKCMTAIMSLKGLSLSKVMSIRGDYCAASIHRVREGFTLAAGVNPCRYACLCDNILAKTIFNAFRKTTLSNLLFIRDYEMYGENSRTTFTLNTDCLTAMQTVDRVEEKISQACEGVEHTAQGRKECKQKLAQGQLASDRANAQQDMAKLCVARDMNTYMGNRVTRRECVRRCFLAGHEFAGRQGNAMDGGQPQCFCARDRRSWGNQGYALRQAAPFIAFEADKPAPWPSIAESPTKATNAKHYLKNYSAPLYCACDVPDGDPLYPLQNCVYDTQTSLGSFRGCAPDPELARWVIENRVAPFKSSEDMVCRMAFDIYIPVCMGCCCDRSITSSTVNTMLMDVNLDAKMDINDRAGKLLDRGCKEWFMMIDLFVRFFVNAFKTFGSVLPLQEQAKCFYNDRKRYPGKGSETPARWAMVKKQLKTRWDEDTSKLMMETGLGHPGRPSWQKLHPETMSQYERARQDKPCRTGGSACIPCAKPSLCVPPPPALALTMT